MEAQDNDLPPSVPFQVAGFPTIKFKPAGTRDFLDYEGERSLESLIAFVEEHAKNSLSPPHDQAQVPLGGSDGNSTDTPVPEKQEPENHEKHVEL
jgi:protein disulfide-isomerase A1